MEFRRHVSSLSAWMESCYSCQPLLYLGKDSIRSCCSVQQGDPLDPLGFALTLHPIIERIKFEVPTLALNAWYLDDGTLVDSPGDISAALQIIASDGSSVGLHLNRGKSLLYIPRDCDASHSPLSPEVPVTHAGFCLLGCPIDPASLCEGVLQDSVAKIRESLEILHEMDDSQLETTLIRSCLVLPKFYYLIRTCPPIYISRATRNFDGLKASLPSSRG